MLPTDWLLRFEHIEAIDTDPVARWLFAWRHGAALKAAGVLWRYQTGDALLALPRHLSSHPRACVLFDNLLGQLRFHAPAWQDPTVFVAHQLASIQRQLQHREWGSVHDLLSGPAHGLAAGQAFPTARPSMASPLTARQADFAWLACVRPESHWLDHLTDQVFPAGTAVHDMAWAFSPGYWHWLQAGWRQPGAAGSDFTSNSAASIQVLMPRSDQFL